MRRNSYRPIVAWLAVIGLAVALCGIAPAQTTINGSSLALRSSGDSAGSDWVLDENGYVGTYITLAEPGPVTIGAQASGQLGGGTAPRMNIVVADSQAGFDVGAGFNHYEHTFDLPAGTYLVRTEFNNDTPAASRELTVRDLTFSGASVSNTGNPAANNASALAAADTYIDHFRRGSAQLALSGVAPGTQVDVKLKRHEFLFGTAVGGFNNTSSASWIAPHPAPGSDPDRLQQAIVDNFNAIVPGNAGKWQQNEFSQDALHSPVLDDMLDFAEQHELRMRMHNLIWGNQQPHWVNSLLDQAAGGNQAAQDALRSQITERIAYYIGNSGTDWSDHYEQVDILNEAIHVPIYMEIFGPEGVADIYAEARDAALAAGNEVGLYANEYNVLQDSGDFYGNWFRRHIEELNQAGAGEVVTGIGIQSYENDALGTGFNAHYPARKMQTLQNLSVLGLPITLTEFGVKDPSEGQFPSEEDAAQMLDETLRLVFGTAQAAGFFMWGFTEMDSYREGAAFYDSDWNPREPLSVWQDRMAEWDTELTLSVGDEGTVDFTGFYGDYEITVDGQTFDLTLSKGDPLYSLAVAPGDYNGDGRVDAADYTVWRDTVGSTGDLRADGNGDRLVDAADYAVWKQHFGAEYPAGSSAAVGHQVPEPAILWLLAGGLVGLAHCRTRHGLRPSSGRSNAARTPEHRPESPWGAAAVEDYTVQGKVHLFQNRRRQLRPAPLHPFRDRPLYGYSSDLNSISIRFRPGSTVYSSPEVSTEA